MEPRKWVTIGKLAAIVVVLAVLTTSVAAADNCGPHSTEMTLEDTASYIYFVGYTQLNATKFAFVGNHVYSDTEIARLLDSEAIVQDGYASRAFSLGWNGIPKWGVEYSMEFRHDTVSVYGPISTGSIVVNHKADVTLKVKQELIVITSVAYKGIASKEWGRNDAYEVMIFLSDGRRVVIESGVLDESTIGSIPAIVRPSYVYPYESKVTLPHFSMLPAIVLVPDKHGVGVYGVFETIIGQPQLPGHRYMTRGGMGYVRNTPQQQTDEPERPFLSMLDIVSVFFVVGLVVFLLEGFRRLLLHIQRCRHSKVRLTIHHACCGYVGETLYVHVDPDDDGYEQLLVLMEGILGFEGEDLTEIVEMVKINGDHLFHPKYLESTNLGGKDVEVWIRDTRKAESWPDRVRRQVETELRKHRAVSPMPLVIVVGLVAMIVNLIARRGPRK